jgi:hypothetical protein
VNEKLECGGGTDRFCHGLLAGYGIFLMGFLSVLVLGSAWIGLAWLAFALVLAGCGFRGLLAVRCQ